MKSFEEYLTEEKMALTKLTPAEWKKPNSAHPDRKPRIDILIDAIKAGTPLQLYKDKKEVVIANTKENLDAAAGFKKDGKAFSLVTKDSKLISSSDLGKSAIFGGGAGAGGGTENTAIVESAQCVWCAAMLKHGVKDNIEWYTDDILTDAYKYTDTGGITIKQILEITPEWRTSSYLAAKILIEQKYVNRSHTFHRDSKQMKYIYAAKNQAFKNSELPAMSHDKWNPGDIWAIAKGVDLKKELDTTNIVTLNSSLVRLYNERKVVGISLKLVKKDAKIQVYNLEGGVADKHKITELTASSARGTYWSSKAAMVVADNKYKLSLKANSYLGTIKMELEGKTARGGGAGWGQVIAYGKMKMGVTFPDNKELRDMANRIQKGNVAWIDAYYKIAKRIDRDIGTREAFGKELEDKDVGWIHAKYTATLVLFELARNKGRKADDFITSIINYAGSKAEESSVYVKVYQ